MMQGFNAGQRVRVLLSEHDTETVPARIIDLPLVGKIKVATDCGQVRDLPADRIWTDKEA